MMHKRSSGLTLRADTLRNEAHLLKNCLKTLDRLKSLFRYTEEYYPPKEQFFANAYLVQREADELIDLFENRKEKLPGRKAASYPRLWEVAQDLLSLCPAALNRDDICSYLEELQNRQPLDIHEIYSLSLYLRAAVLNRVGLLAQECEAGCKALQDADRQAEQLLKTQEETAVSEALRKNSYMRDFNGLWLERMETLLTDEALGQKILEAIAAELNETGRNMKGSIVAAHHQSAQLSSRLSILLENIRFLRVLDLSEFIDQISPVEAMLMEDPSGVYPKTDEYSRQAVRGSVTQNARKLKVSEYTLVQNALALALEGQGLERNICWYLCDEGLPALCSRLNRAYKPDFTSSLAGYRLLRALFCLLFGSLAALGARLAGAALIPRLLVGLFCAQALVERSGALASNLMLRGKPGKTLLRMKLKEGVPAEGRTLCVLTALADSENTVNRLCEGLHMCSLRNPDKEIFFGLLMDLPLSAAEDDPKDKAILESAQAALKKLNERYGQRFYLLVRKRRFNVSENIFMPRERKRGALLALARWIRQGDPGDFIPLGDFSALPEGIRYILTLDADTTLGYDVIRKIVACALHPLNKAHIAQGQVQRGHGVISPGLDVLKAPTPFAELMLGRAGIDGYSRVRRDRFMDLNAGGNFTGKGLWDINALTDTAVATLPEGCILSHDLLEGEIAHCGFDANTVFYESYPKTFSGWLKRAHRWARGDLQTVLWAYGKEGKRILSAKSRFKLLEPIRSVLCPVFVILALGAGAVFSCFTPVAALLWIVLLLPYLKECFSFWKNTAHLPISLRVKEIIRLLKQGLWKVSLAAAEAVNGMDALIRSWVRMKLSKKNLLQWATASASDISDSLMRTYLSLLPSALIGVSLFALVLFTSGTLADKLLALYPLSFTLVPYWAYRLSKPQQQKPEPRYEDLLGTAARTYGYFRRFATSAEHFLPPDNVQEYPLMGTASRTSPTNIGFGLAAHVCAYELGLLTKPAFIRNVEQMITSMEKLERWKGHPYNWINTRTLEPLPPRYVSFVDSGNLLCYALLTAQALRNVQGGLLGLDRLTGLAVQVANWAENDKSALPFSRRLRDSQHDLDVLYPLLEELCGKAEQADTARSRIIAADAAELLELLKTPRAIWQNLSAEQKQQITPDGLFTAEVLRTLKAQTDHDELCSLLDELLFLDDYWTQKAVDCAQRLEGYAHQIDLAALYDPKRKLFRIGYHADTRRFDEGHYDLLASEARQSSLAAIALGQVEAEHYEHLGRLCAYTGSGTSLLSWGGSMFEYLMPGLIFEEPAESLLGQACLGAVWAQINYTNPPWGISESGYGEYDKALHYQYATFGIPGLGLRESIEQDHVITPYASALAIRQAPAQAHENLNLLSDIGMLGEYGYYEALDYTPKRAGEGKDRTRIAQYMAHHQGMLLCALTNHLKDNILQRIFLRIPEIRAVNLLLQERPASPADTVRPIRKVQVIPHALPAEIRLKRSYQGSEGFYPLEAHLLGGGDYTLYADRLGNTHSLWKGKALYRFRNDPYAANDGLTVLLRQDGELFIPAEAPFIEKNGAKKVTFTPSGACYSCEREDVTIRMELTALPGCPGEIRIISVDNRSSESFLAELNVYFEPVMLNIRDDEAHMVFRSLFITSEFDTEKQLLTFTRRPRSDQEEPMAISCGFLTADGFQPFSYGTSRAEVLGRHRSVGEAAFLTADLPDIAHSVPDTACAARYSLIVKPNGHTQICFALGCGVTPTESKEALEKILQTETEELVHREELTEQANMRYFGLTPGLYQLSTAILKFLNGTVRQKRPDCHDRPLRRETLWRAGISGDVPLILLTVESEDGLQNAAYLLKIHAWLAFKGIPTELVLVSLRRGGYRRELRNALEQLTVRSVSHEVLNVPNGVFILDIHEQKDIVIAAETAACLVLDAERRLNPQLKAEFKPLRLHHRTEWEPRLRALDEAPLSPSGPYGGFGADGSYTISLQEGKHTPLPWSNILCNSTFGALVSESGGGFVYAGNSALKRLTVWQGDPLRDDPSEALYVRDQDTKEWFSPLSSAPRQITHGFGFSRFAAASESLETQATVCVPVGEACKIILLEMKNTAGTERKVDITYLTAFSGKGPRMPKPLGQSGVSVLRSGLMGEANGIAYIALPGQRCSYSLDSSDCVGVPYSLKDPICMKESILSACCPQPSGDVCALRCSLTLLPRESKRITVLLGCEETEEAVMDVLHRYENHQYTEKALGETQFYWREKLSILQVHTPDTAFDTLINGWLLYQTMAGRFYARTGYYQQGGAIGFRDQLQDAMALLWCDPQITRRHLLVCAARQYTSGDVQHWWHEDGSGVRTHISDDLLFLPWCAAQYALFTGDWQLFDEQIPYLEEKEFTGEDLYYKGQPSNEMSSFYEHCVRAIHRACVFGEHGLPLMGGGDWNDGMNRVGHAGKGESIWLGWFLYRAAGDFIPVVQKKQDKAEERFLEELQSKLRTALEEHAWDGHWYRRAFFDDGTPLGSKENEECSIDLISQAWAVLSQAASRERCESAMDSAAALLVDEQHQLIRLLWPPLDKSEPNPGYIRSYLPGVRENGAQYTHAAAWFVLACAQMGRWEEAYEYFSLLNPINHTQDDQQTAQYKTEPYAVAADVYSLSSYAGQGGWTWYTGAAGWLYRTAVEGILGLKKEGNVLKITPRLPAAFDQVNITYRQKDTVYQIHINNEEAGTQSVMFCDGVLCPDGLPLTSDGKTHLVQVCMIGRKEINPAKL